jgi:ribosomal protein S27AE
MISKSVYICPRCGSAFLVISEQKFYCLRCRLIYNYKNDNEDSPNYMLSEEDLNVITKTLSSMKSNE